MESGAVFCVLTIFDATSTRLDGNIFLKKRFPVVIITLHYSYPGPVPEFKLMLPRSFYAVTLKIKVSGFPVPRILGTLSLVSDIMPP